jgi:mycothiol synthase
LDQGLLARWLADAQQNNKQFELGFWDGAYPEDKLQAVAELYELVNQVPVDDLQVEDMHFSPAQLRLAEKNLFSQGTERWTFYLMDRAMGKFAGYTDTEWNPNRPELLTQAMTGVFPEYRNKGLGRWLKAVMLDKILKERPQVKYIRSYNADSNAAMLKINNALGFKPYTVETLWQVETQKVQDYLQASS